MIGNELQLDLTSQLLYIVFLFRIMKVYLCGEKGCCPYVEIKKSVVLIGEEGNLCRLTIEQFNALKEKIIKGEI